jgi:hypothetical protein
MKRVSLAAPRARLFISVFSLCLLAPEALAEIYVTGSGSLSTRNADLTRYETQAGSGTIDFGLGRYVRIGFTHEQEFEITKGYEQPDKEKEEYVKLDAKTHVVANSVDLTLILYDGDVFVPYIKGGLIRKSYKFEVTKGTDTEKADFVIPVTYNLGAGVGLRLNRQFTLKLGYMVSPGIQREPGQPVEEAKTVLDKKSTIGLTYQL